MKLQEYFNQHKEHYLSDVQKINMYHQVMQKQMQKSFHKKRSFLHVKSFVYSCFIIFVLVGFYGMYFFDQNRILDMEGFVVTNQNNNVAQADFIAKVVDFAGTFYIENKDGKVVQTSNITDGDTVVLKQNTQIVFHINTGTQAKIIGPAKFVLDKKSDNSFKLNLLYGEYVEMSSLQQKNTQNVELSVDNILVAQGERSKPMNYQLIKQGENHIIKNNGANLLVTTQDKKASTKVTGKQVLAIQGNDISLFDSFDKFAKAVKDNNLSQTFTLNTNNSQTSSQGSGTSETGIKELDTKEILSITDEKETTSISNPSVTSLVSDDKKIANIDQTKLISNQFNKDFLSNNLEQLTLAYTQGNDEKFKKSFSELEKRVRLVSESFGYTYILAQGEPKAKLESIKIAIGELDKYITTNYLLPPKYLESIKKTITRIQYIQSRLYGETTTITGTNNNNQIPGNIHF